MKILRFILCAGVAFGTLAANANAQTNTNEFTGLGSSALFLELGEAAIARATTVASGLSGTYNVCTWSTKDADPGSGGLPDKIYSNDQAPSIQNTGSFWAVWTQTPACNTGGPAAKDVVDIWTYLQEDSAVGNRCVFRTGSTEQECLLVVPASGAMTVTGQPGLGLITATNTDAPSLPTDVINALNGVQFGVAGTDIRPEDSQFAIYRAEQATSTALGTAPGAIYYGMGLGTSGCATIAVTGSTYDGGGHAASSVTAAGFALPGGTDPCTGVAGVTKMDVTPVGATPVIIAVNATNSSGFGSTAITNVTTGALAGYLTGELCRTADAAAKTYTAGAPDAITFIREPFSGTYNTLEYSIPANRGVQGSQEYGVATPTTQPTVWTTCNGKGGSRQRVTSTGNMVYAIQNTEDSLGYFFWSVANAAKFTNTNGTPVNGKYLTVNGVDPIKNTYTNGCIPTAGTTTNCDLGYITFAGVKGGNYPIWSIQRLVTTCVGAGCTPTQQSEAAKMASAAQSELTTTPDFAAINTLDVLHTHYLPPVPASLQGTLTVANGNFYCTGSVESGGDIAGEIISKQADADYCSDFGVTTGLINLLGNGTSTNGNPGQRQ